MKIPFTKMQGLGNDFVVIDAIHLPGKSFTCEQLRFIADRHFGVGCDQVLIVERPTQPGADFRYRIFNPDGGEVQQCGNGARCFAHFVRDKGLTSKSELCIETAGGLIYPRIETNGDVTVNLGTPDFEPAHIPFLADNAALDYELSVEGAGTCRIGAVSMGNPHAVLIVDDIDNAPVTDLGRRIEQHPRFPQRVNVGFAQILSRDHLRLRVFERGAGETLACGSGACAAVAVCHQRKTLSDKVTVTLPGGSLIVSWSGSNQPVWMTGPATYVFEGTIEL